MMRRSRLVLCQALRIMVWGLGFKKKVGSCKALNASRIFLAWLESQPLQACLVARRNSQKLC